ncbi:molybdopterin-dependent oxidoreductase [Streptomyces sp. ERV7]|uniref:molybdopterin-dependent oxidoreductase n=1 Tax=Streptomyces sp. ERV7 TaxID=1322334 RepID=UPI0007F37B20|nr:molybdopterin-dependent oxidoreductase [Streptomyces sp. ERV7]OAR23414.1 molybdopterin-dependent oxidoreductase [Streptomyces sp. ERV7]
MTRTGFTEARRNSDPSSQVRSFALCGDVLRPATLTVVDLRQGWESHRADVVFDCATNGPQRHRFEGPLLRDVVAAAGPAFDVRRRKDRSRFLLAVSGGDGHHAVLAWAEIDADFGDKPILLATRMDGRELDAEGSQLVVPPDRCGARYVSAITSIWIGGFPPAAQMP